MHVYIRDTFITEMYMNISIITFAPSPRIISIINATVSNKIFPLNVQNDLSICFNNLRLSAITHNVSIIPRLSWNAACKASFSYRLRQQRSICIPARQRFASHRNAFQKGEVGQRRFIFIFRVKNESASRTKYLPPSPIALRVNSSSMSR